VPACAPPNAAADILDRLTGLRDEDHEQANALDDSFCDRRGDADMLIDPVPQPVRVKRRSNETATAVLDANDDGPSTRRIRHAGDLVGQVPRGFLTMWVAHQERAARPTPPGLLFEVNLLALDRVWQHASREFGERPVYEGFQPRTRLDLISTRIKRRHRTSLRNYQIRGLLI
jgi:hypothetical protein